MSEKETKRKKNSCKNKSNDFENLDEDFFADKFDKVIFFYKFKKIKKQFYLKDISLEIDPNDSLLLAMLTPENRLNYSKRTFLLKSIYNVALSNNESPTSNDD